MAARRGRRSIEKEPERDSPAQAQAMKSGRAGAIANWGFLDRLFAWVLYPTVMAVTLVFLTVRPVSDPDCWFHMALGRYWLEHGHVPDRDIFSHTAAGREWISSGWGASVILELVFRRWGLAGLAWTNTFLLALYYGILYIVGYRRTGQGEWPTLLILLSMLAGYMRFNPRPDFFTLVCFALFFWLLLSFDNIVADPRSRERWKLLALPCVMLAWANLHVGFLAGLIVLWIAVAGSVGWPRRDVADRRGPFLVILAGLVCSVAWLINPYGGRLANLATKIQAIPGVRMLVYEWMPLIYLPGFNLPWPNYLGYFLLGGLTMAVFRARGRDVPLWHLGAAVFLAAFALWQRRQGGLFALGVPVLVSAHMVSAAVRWQRYRHWTAACVLAMGPTICALQYAGLLQMGGGWPATGVNGSMLPCLATAFLSRQPTPPKLFNSYGMGGYLLYHLGPKIPVFIDGRLDIYDAQVWRDYLAAEENRMSIAQVRQKYGVNTFAIESRGSIGDPIHLATRLAHDPDWALVFFDDDFAVFVRRDLCDAQLASRELRYVNPFALERFEEALRVPALQDRLLEELRYALEISNGCALAYVLAAAGAEANGETEAAHRYRAIAAQRDSLCPLLTWRPRDINTSSPPRR